MARPHGNRIRYKSRAKCNVRTIPSYLCQGAPNVGGPFEKPVPSNLKLVATLLGTRRQRKQLSLSLRSSLVCSNGNEGGSSSPWTMANMTACVRQSAVAMCFLGLTVPARLTLGSRCDGGSGVSGECSAITARGEGGAR